MNDSLTDQEQKQQRKARLMMLAVVAIFILPFFILPLFMSPEGLGKTNKGTLIQPHIALEELVLIHDQQAVTAAFLEKRWTLLYVMPETCDAVCVSARNNALYAMRQVRLSLDRSVERVQQVLVNTSEWDGELSALVEKEFSVMKIVQGNSQTLEQALFSRLPERNSAGSIFLMSPDGYVFMVYPTFVDEQESILRARDIRADLKKSIKGERRS